MRTLLNFNGTPRVCHSRSCCGPLAVGCTRLYACTRRPTDKQPSVMKNNIPSSILGRPRARHCAENLQTHTMTHTQTRPKTESRLPAASLGARDTAKPPTTPSLRRCAGSGPRSRPSVTSRLPRRVLEENQRALHGGQVEGLGQHAVKAHLQEVLQVPACGVACTTTTAAAAAAAAKTTTVTTTAAVPAAPAAGATCVWGGGGFES